MRRVYICLLILVPLVGWLLGCGGVPGEKEYRSGLRAMKKGEYVRARTQLEKSLNRRPASPKNAEVYNYLGIIAYRLDRLDEAVDAFQNSHTHDPQFAPPLYNLGVIAHESGDDAQALPLLEQSQVIDASDTRALVYIAQIYESHNDYPRARRALLSALSRDPQSPEILTRLALIKYAEGDEERATFELMQALENDPDYSPALYNLGVIFQVDGQDHEQAKAYLTKFLDLSSDQERQRQAGEWLEQINRAAMVDASVDMPKPTDVSHVETPDVSLEQVVDDKEPVAVDVLEEAEDVAGKGEKAAALDLFLKAALMAEQENNRSLQEKALTRAASVCFDQAAAHYELGLYRLDHEDYESALGSFKKSLLLDSSSISTRLGLAEAAVGAGEYDTALVSLKQAVKMDPSNPDILWSLAVLYDQHLGMDEKATQTFRSFVEAFPTDPRSMQAMRAVKQSNVASGSETTEHDGGELIQSEQGDRTDMVVKNVRAAIQAYNRGSFYQDRQDWDRALFFYRRAVENDSSFVAAYYNLGTVYWQKGEYASCIKAYKNALEIQSDMVNARYNLALAYDQLGEVDEAANELRTLIRQDPTYAQAYYFLGVLAARNEADIQQAKHYYRQFLELDPTSSAAPSVRQWMAEN